jgi:hypothetical protein
VTDLATWLLDRIAEDEAVARAARLSNGQWEFVGEHWPNPSLVREWGADVTPVGKSSLDWDRHAHIARHDPARVLAECAAKRRIVELHKSWPVMVETPPELTGGDDIDNMTFRLTKQIAWLTQEEYRKKFGSEPPTTPVLRLLALPYADHDGYDPSWGVQ